jgi:hypothetical protein
MTEVVALLSRGFIASRYDPESAVASGLLLYYLLRGVIHRTFPLSLLTTQSSSFTTDRVVEVLYDYKLVMSTFSTGYRSPAVVPHTAFKRQLPLAGKGKVSSTGN